MQHTATVQPVVDNGAVRLDLTSDLWINMEPGQAIMLAGTLIRTAHLAAGIPIPPTFTVTFTD